MVINFAFLDLGKNISFSDTLLDLSLCGYAQACRITSDFDVFLVMFVELTENHFLCKFSVSPGCIRKIVTGFKVNIAAKRHKIHKKYFIYWNIK